MTGTLSDSPISVNTAENSSVYVLSVQPYSAHSTYTVGDVLDVAVTFSSPVKLIKRGSEEGEKGIEKEGEEGGEEGGESGSAILVLRGQTEGQDMTLTHVTVARTQYVTVQLNSTYALQYESELTMCMYAVNVSDMHVQLYSLYLLRPSFPLEISYLAGDTGMAVIRLDFSGVSPYVFSPVLKSFCSTGYEADTTTESLSHYPSYPPPSSSSSPSPSSSPSSYSSFSSLIDDSYSSSPSTSSFSTSISVDPSLLYALIFRRNVGYGDRGISLIYPNTSSLLVPLGGDFIIVKNSLSVNITLPTTRSTGLRGINVSTDVPYITAVYSTLSSVAVDNDNIDIIVNMSHPVSVHGFPYLLISFQHFLTDTDRNTNTQSVSSPVSTDSTFSISAYTRRAYYVGGGYSKRNEGDSSREGEVYGGMMMVFRYTVVMGDTASPVRLSSNTSSPSPSPSSSSFFSSSSFSSSSPSPPSSLFLNGGSILSLSDNPQQSVNISLPPHIISSFQSLNITINANGHAVLTNITSDTPPGTYSTGTKITVFLHFSGPVFTVFNPSSSLGISFSNPKYSEMFYSTGSGTKILSFIYTVLEGQNAHPLSFKDSSSSFNIHINQGYFRDILGNVFTNITKSPLFSSLDYLVIDTAETYVVKVDSSSKNGIYYPGNIIDISVYFSKSVYIFTDFGMPSIELFVPYQSVKTILAHYVHGNGSKIVHFNYTVPSPPTSHNIRPTIWLDYANIASLLSYLNGSVFREITGGAVNVLLPVAQNSYLRYSRELLISFTVPEVLTVSSLNTSGIYSAGDVILIEVKFTQIVTVFIPPVLRLFTSSKMDGKGGRDIYHLNYDYDGSDDYSYHANHNNFNYHTYENRFGIDYYNSDDYNRIDYSTDDDIDEMNGLDTKSINDKYARLFHQNRSATYISGNNTASLLFSYTVRIGDNSGMSGLDYVDTRYDPYGYSTYDSSSLVSWAMSTDVTIGTYGWTEKVTLSFHVFTTLIHSSPTPFRCSDHHLCGIPFRSPSLDCTPCLPSSSYFSLILTLTSPHCVPSILSHTP